MSDILNLASNSTEINRLHQELRKFEPARAIALRREWKEIGTDLTNAIKSEVGSGGESRRAVVQGTSSRVSFSKRSAGLKILTSGKHLPADHQGFHRVLNAARSRHPLFGNKEYWFAYEGKPYFANTISKHLPEAQQRFLNSLDDAVRAIGGRVR